MVNGSSGEITRSERRMRAFFDYDIIIDNKFDIYVVLGNFHPPGAVLAVKKYSLAPPSTAWPWKLGGAGLKREFEVCEPSVMSSSQRVYWDLELKAPFPVLSTSSVRAHLLPELGLERLIKRARDVLEMRALEAVDRLHSLAGVPSNALGVTGSLLLGTQKLGVSDVDLIVYDCSYAGAIREVEPLEPLRGRDLLEWSLRASRRTGLPPTSAVMLYDKARRGSLDGMLVSILYVEPRPRRAAPLIGCNYLGEAELLIEFEPLGCQHHYFPHILEGRVLEVLRAPRAISSRRGGIKVISFESLYASIPDLYPSCRAAGKLFECHDGAYALLVGLREARSFLVPLGSLSVEPAGFSAR